MKTNLQISFYIASMPDSPTCSEERNWGMGFDNIKTLLDTIYMRCYKVELAFLHYILAYSSANSKGGYKVQGKNSHVMSTQLHLLLLMLFLIRKAPHSSPELSRGRLRTIAQPP